MSLSFRGPAPQWELAHPSMNVDPPLWSSWAAVALIVVSTIAGAWLARKNASKIGLWLSVASASMLVTVLTELLPEAWQEAVDTGTPLWAIALAGVFGYSVITYFTRRGCGHRHTGGGKGRRHAPGLHRRVKRAVNAAVFGGVGTASALIVHRMMEGTTLVLALSVVVVAALMVHSASEGLALTAMLELAGKPLAPWLTASCLSPAAGVLLAEILTLPPQSMPILLAVLAGVLLRTAVIGLQMARVDGGLRRRHLLPVAATALSVGALLAAAQVLLSDRTTPFTPASAHTAAHATATPRPTGTPAATPPPAAPTSRSQLREAVAAGQITLHALLSRTDPTTVGTPAGWLLRALPGRSPDAIAQTLQRAGIDSDADIGDLTLRQRNHLLATLATD
ncbi:Zinc transporter ZupT [Nonomuraea maritima]|uniref:Zinc transporter ZupT n=1 Tax=Nonomuraea maritima TaxID=683260 RepID=A0A1G9P5E6_9ACTN|nr:hypothetical protein [Nonomuraea maritima]SDL93721.1 Zinc transporter ZupT [Nonomuraea maritima]